jgi:AraC-like DNA-binding protein
MTRISGDRCSVPPAFWRAFAELGIRPADILKHARLSPVLHANAQARFTTTQLFNIWRAIEELSLDPGLAFKIIEAMDASGHQPALLAALYAANYRDGIARIERFKRNSPSEQFLFDERDGEFSVRKIWHFAAEPEPAVSVDLSFAFLLELGRRGTGLRLTPTRVDFVRTGPKSDLHNEHFGCPIRYGAPHNMIVLKSSDLDRAFGSHNLEFLDLVTSALQAARTDLDAKGSLSEQVKAAIKGSLASGRPDLADIASALGTSERTLQRRITEEGTTFRRLLTEARQELASVLLASASISVDEVAYMLGYEDTRSFYRAFKEWHGTTPHRWRSTH